MMSLPEKGEIHLTKAVQMCSISADCVALSECAALVMLQAGVGRVRANLASQVKKGKMTQEGLDAVMKRLTGTLTYDSFKPIDMVRSATAAPAATSLLQTNQPSCKQWSDSPKPSQTCIPSDLQLCSAVVWCLARRPFMRPSLDGG